MFRAVAAAGGSAGRVGVQPVLLRFPYRNFNPSWESIPVSTHFFRMLTQAYCR